MILAASSTHATASINIDYYVTNAAVIPTLFIAIAVQGGVPDTLATAARDKASTLIRPAVAALTTTRGWLLVRPVLRILGFAYAAIFLTAAALGILIAGWIGEGAALWAVVAKEDNPVLLITTLTATGILVIAATAQPFQKLFGAYADVARTITNAVGSANPAAARDGESREPVH